jgi:uncharacterized protein Veg
MGNYVLTPHQSDSVFIVELDKKQQDHNREKFGFLNDADEFDLG